MKLVSVPPGTVAATVRVDGEGTTVDHIDPALSLVVTRHPDRGLAPAGVLVYRRGDAVHVELEEERELDGLLVVVGPHESIVERLADELDVVALDSEVALRRLGAVRTAEGWEAPDEQTAERVRSLALASWAATTAADELRAGAGPAWSPAARQALDVLRPTQSSEVTTPRAVAP